MDEQMSALVADGKMSEDVYKQLVETLGRARVLISLFSGASIMTSCGSRNQDLRPLRQSCWRVRECGCAPSPWSGAV